MGILLTVLHFVGLGRHPLKELSVEGSTGAEGVGFDTDRGRSERVALGGPQKVCCG